MELTLPFNLQSIAPILFIAMAFMVIFVRMRAARRPVTTKKIILAPLGMSTGFLMFLYPPTHIPLTWGVISFFIGALFLSYPLIRTTHFQIAKGQIYLKRSKAFIFILLGLLGIRLLLRNYVEQHLSLEQTASVFFTLAFGMIVTWRTVMYFKFRKIRQEQENQSLT